MRKIVIDSDEPEGLEGLFGQRITVWCLNYIYTGDLVGVDGECIRLDNAAVVYETGPLKTKEWQDVQALPNPCYIMHRCIESFMVLK
jgi:hypothetical protein